MFKKGQKYRMIKKIATPDHKDEEKAVNAEVAYVPAHRSFISFRFHFNNLFGEHTSYTESILMSELEQMVRNGKIKKR